MERLRASIFNGFIRISRSEESLERGAMEDGADHAYQLSAVKTDGSRAGHRLLGRGMPQERVLEFWRYPYAAAETVSVKVADIHPDSTVRCRHGEPDGGLFILSQYSADPIARIEGRA